MVSRGIQSQSGSTPPSTTSLPTTYCSTNGNIDAERHCLYGLAFLQAGGVDAVESEFGDGRTPSLCRPPAGMSSYLEGAAPRPQASWAIDGPRARGCRWRARLLASRDGRVPR